ncbi:reverse transcriptase domain-containing protein [Tanacetum coccineum]
MDRRKVVKEEVEEWLKSGIVKRVRYPTWVANPVLVKKADGSWRMCIDFKDLNKACPKDLYPLPEIDWKIESLMGLRNARATYQRLVDTIFKGQIGRNLEAYVDDMVIKKAAEEAFQAMKKLIAELPTLTAPMKDEELMVYLSEASEAVSAVLLVERNGSKEEQTALESISEADTWKLYTDGASNDHGSGAGLILIDPQGMEYSYALRLNFCNSNNDAESEALLAGLRIAVGMKVERMHAFVDSNLVENQMLQISHILREENKKANALSKLAAVQCEGLTKGILVEELNERSVDVVEVNVMSRKKGGRELQ